MIEDFSKYNGEGTILRKAQLKMLDILVEVDKICKKNNIPYWLDYGTLLGAVRHKGFIPWDDDLDISCLESDYKRLKYALNEELPTDLVFQDWKNEKKLLMKMGKVRFIKSYFEEKLYSKGALKYQGIYIDIFPIVTIPSQKLRKRIDFYYGRAYRRIRGYGKRNEFYIALVMWPFVNILVAFSKFLNFFIGKDLFSNIYGSITLESVHKRDEIFPLSTVEFEGKIFPAPANTDIFLKNIYGNYMIIPDVNKRIIHADLIEYYD